MANEQIVASHNEIGNSIRGKVAVVTDSVAQVPAEIEKQLDIRVVPSTLVLEGRKYQDGVDLALEELYQRMREENLMVQTTSPPVGTFYQTFMHLVNEGVKEILYIGLSREMSATYSAAQNGARLTLEKYPDRDIILFDSKKATIAQGYIVIEAARLAVQGASLEQIVARAEQVREHTGLVATLETLEYLAHGGRIGKIAYMLGAAVKILPIVTFGDDGTVAPVSMGRSDDSALRRMVTFVEEKTRGCRSLHLAIMQADAQQRATKLSQIAKDRLDPTEIIMTHFTPVMVAHAGPGLIGIAYFYE
jgi:DegV family protein with EDD domain